MGISCFIVSLNEEKHIRRCLESVRWCDEIIVLDSGSTDRTVEIAKEYTAKVIHHPWKGYVKQKQAALDLCTQEWVLNIDSDEEVSEELKNEIQALVGSPGSSQNPLNGYKICRVVYYLGRWWRRGGWYPEYRMRFFRRSAAYWGGRDPHEKAVVKGKTGRLAGEIHHYTYENLSDHAASLNQHASSAAESLYELGRKSSLLKITVNPVMRFLKFYVIKGGFRDGTVGLIAAVLEAYYVFLKYTKLWELWRGKERQ